MRVTEYFSRLVPFALPHRKYALVLAVALLLLAALEPLLAGLMQPLLDKSLIQRDPVSQWRVPLFLAFVFILKGIAEYVSSVAGQVLAFKTVADIRATLFERYLSTDLDQLSDLPLADRLSRMTYDVSILSETISSAWVSLLKDTLLLVSLLAFMFYLSWQLTLVVLTLMPLAGLLIHRISHRLRHTSHEVQDAMSALSSHTQESILGLREVRVFGMERGVISKFQSINQGLRQACIRITRLSSLNVPVVQTIAAVSVSLVVFFASWLASKAMLTPGGFLSFVVAVAMVFEPIRRLTSVNAVLQKGAAAGESVFGLLDAPARHEIIQTSELKRPLTAASAVEFEQVSFSYRSESAPVLESLSFRVASEDSLMIVGRSGSGKSTALQLACGLLRPTSGSVLLGGLDTRTTPISELRRHVSLVSQAVFLFDASIEDNIRMGRPDATPEEIYEAARVAGVTEFADQLPLRIKTQIGTLGGKLSGGQRQRISIARALVKNAPLILLDEPTSALDDESARYVSDSLARLMQGRAVILVTHIPSNFLEFRQVINLTK